MLGTTVSHYKILEKIGAGGMGEVYLAEDTKLKRQVALKFLSEELTRDEERKQRFLQEARAAAAVEHPHIAAIYDIDEVDGPTFIAMEYVRGESLRAAIDAEKLNQRQSLELAIQIGEGLSKAHERGVVHRDVKPGNVVVSEDGDAKIIDFGLAKLFEPPTGGDGPVESEAETLLKTQEGMVLGTLTYMSPEQASGEPLNPRTDIFSLGAVLYEMHSGVSPFRRETPVATLRALLEESPPTLPESAAPTKLQRILGKALAKERSERYASMKDLLADLEELRDSLYPPAAPATSHPGIRKWLRAGAALGVAVLVAAAFYLGSRRATPPGIGASGRPAVAVMYFESMTGDEEIQWLSKGLPSMLVTDLSQTPGLDVVSSQRIQEILAQVGEDNLESIDRNLFTEIARRAGAGAVVLGSIFKSGDVIRIDVQLEDVASGRLLSAQSVRGADVFPLVDELTVRIRTSLEVGDRPGGRGIAEITTPSLEAYQLYSEGLEALRNLRAVDASTFFLQAVEVDPSFAMAYFQLSKAARQLGELDLAERYLQEALEFQDKLPERQRLQIQAADARRATRRGEEGAFQDAVEQYATLISRYPDEADYYVELATLYRGEDNAKFITTLERGVEAVPSSGQLHNNLGYGLLRAGRFLEAIRAFEIYASLNPGEPNPQDSLGDAYLVSGQPEKALERFTRALEIAPSFYRAHDGRAWAYGMLGRYDEAVEEMDAQGRFVAREGDPAGRGQINRAYLLSRVGRYDEAEHDLLETMQEVDISENKEPLSRCELVAGIIAIERAAYPRALEHAQRLQRLLPLVPNELQRIHRAVQAHLLAGVAEARAGNLEAARAQLEAQNRLDFDYDMGLWFHGALAGEVALAEGDLTAAESAFAGGEPEFKMQASRWQIAANGLPFRDGLARVKRARGDLAGAIEIYRLLNTPDIANKWTAMVEPRYVLETARLLDETGDKVGARAEYERFLDLWKNADADLPELSEARAYLAQ